MKRFIIFFVLFAFITIFSFTQANIYEPQKFALVIGNGAYVHTTRLNNPVNDANDMEAALRALGFTVDKVLNGSQDQMVNAVMQLKRRLGASRSSYGFLFYAGHGVQSGGENFLIPVDANIPSENFLRNRTVSVQEMLDELNDAGNEFNVVVLDACRDNPFSWRRSGSRGLSVVGHQPADSIIVYATAAGSTASDGTGRNGLFTSHLLNNLRIPGLEVTEVFRRTGADVASASGNSQRPAVYNQFYGTAYLGTRPPAVQPPAQSSQPALAVATVPANMVRINGGTFTMGSPANETGRDSDEIQRQVTVSSFYMGKYEVTVGEFRRFVNAAGYITDAEKSGGGFVWTTEWEMIADANWKNPYFYQGENHPVTLVSWNDTVQYCNWLSRQEGLTPAYTISGANVIWNRSANGYRLPTEAEWEYACRAGTSMAYNTGTGLTTSQANYNNTLGSTTPTGYYSANGWGLYDMHGNVQEWCWDWYGDYASGAQTDPIGVSSGSNRVNRGGTWADSAANVRSAYRRDINPTDRAYSIGFRVVRN